MQEVFSSLSNNKKMGSTTSEREKRERESPRVTRPLRENAKMLDSICESRKDDAPISSSMPEKNG